MPSRTYFLQTKTNEKLWIFWKSGFKTCHIKLNNKEIFHSLNRKSLLKGFEYKIDYERTLGIKLYSGLGVFYYPEILLNGEPVPGSFTDPFVKVKKVFQLVLFIAVVNIFAGGIAKIMDFKPLLDAGIGIASVFYGGIFLILSYLINKLNLWALYLALSLTMLDILYVLFLTFENQDNALSSIPVKVVFVLLMFQGIPAIKKIQKKQELEKQIKKESMEESPPSSKKITSDHNPYMPR
ncbi:MAG: hypothetical protein JXJ22_18275 [Bacteroidales bacterium]|nr:hypothetical protein [Bacteroidales bacterium]